MRCRAIAHQSAALHIYVDRIGLLDTSTDIDIDTIGLLSKISRLTLPEMSM